MLNAGCDIAVWPEPFKEMIPDSLKFEAAKRFRIHQPPDSLEEWKRVRGKLIDEIWRNLGSRPDHALDLEFRETGETKMDGYVVKNIVFQSRENFHVTGNLYVPNGNGPFPAILNMHGHWSQGRLAARVQSRGHTFAKNGYVCLCVDAFGSGERTTRHCEFEYHGGHIGASLLDVGETLMGMQIVDNMRAVDLLRSFEFVDSDSIGATGASGGGNQTMWVSALDDRIKASVPVVSVGSFQSYVMGSNCVCELLPNGLEFMEESMLMALTAPRALKICNALGDSNPTFHPSEMLRTFKNLRKVYQAYGADDQLAYQVFNLPHGYWPEVREAAIGWFDRILKGEGCGLPKAEIPFDTLEEERVQCFPKGERDEKVVSIPEFCAKQADVLKESVFNGKIDAEEKKRELRGLLKLDNALGIRGIHHHGSIPDGRLSWTKTTVELADGLLLPLIFSKPIGGDGEIAILASPEGKNSAKLANLVDEAQKRGQGMILPDLYGFGETAVDEDERTDFMKDHLVARALLWLGKTMMGKWVDQLLVLKAFAERELGASKVSVAGFGELGLAAVFAEAVDGGFSRTTAIGAPLSYRAVVETPPFSMGIHLPGIINWGDIAMAAAISADDVRFANPVSMDGTPLSESEEKKFSDDLKRLKSLTV